MEIEKVKQEYLKRIEIERERLKNNPFRDKIFMVLNELEERIKEFKGGKVVLLSDLKEPARQNVLNLYGEDGNYDTIPLFILECGE